mmetsp:Transcript_20758/g.71332  ORF Transcript_20758/g.71332 Transcript_20758/m.71332 type:complete len:146 (+) Transcript_20758:174-611(+)
MRAALRRFGDAALRRAACTDRGARGKRRRPFAGDCGSFSDADDFSDSEAERSDDDGPAPAPPEDPYGFEDALDSPAKLACAYGDREAADHPKLLFMRRPPPTPDRANRPDRAADPPDRSDAYGDSPSRGSPAKPHQRRSLFANGV